MTSKTDIRADQYRHKSGGTFRSVPSSVVGSAMPFVADPFDYLASSVKPQGETSHTPVSNTGGNSSLSVNEEAHPLCIDTLSLTGKIDDFPSELSVTDNDVINEFIGLLQSRLGLTAVCDGGGMNGYHNAAKLQYCDDRPHQNLGFVAWGGNRATFQIYLTGEVCEYIHMIDGWSDVHYIAEFANMKIKRIDIALDDFAGDLDIDTAISLYEAGEFKIRRNPKIKQIGNFIDADDTDGRTVYIGSRDNGKMMRIYEKGKQLGDGQSPWVRWELELKSVDRVIPLDALLNYPDFYAGSYPALANFKVSTVHQVIATVKKVAKITLNKLVEHANNSYGKLFNVLQDGKKEAEDILHLVTRDGVPKRLIIPVPVKSVSILSKVIDPIFIPLTEEEYSFGTF